MAISPNIQDLERDKFIESDVVAGQPVVAVSNADGSPISFSSYSSGTATADKQISGNPGFIHTITISPIGSVVAGVITVYDSLTETGTVLFSYSAPVTTFTPFTVTIDSVVANGIYVGYDATVTNVRTGVSYK